ncbi:hypothetical protein PMIN03_008661 [Paraphaeosphaeria minitans]
MNSYVLAKKRRGNEVKGLKCWKEWSNTAVTKHSLLSLQGKPASTFLSAVRSLSLQSVNFCVNVFSSLHPPPLLVLLQTHIQRRNDMRPRCERGCILCTSGLTYTLEYPFRPGPVFSPACRAHYIQRYVWRVRHSRPTVASNATAQNTRTKPSVAEIADRQEAKMAVSSHLLGNRSNGSAFISLSASLMWALDFAYNKNRDGHHDIHLYLIDTFKIPSRVWPAHLLLSYLQLPANTERARRNLCHEYLVDNELPAQAILGEMPIRFAGIKFADERLRMLLPQLSELDPRQPLEILSSLESCRRPFRVGLKRSLTPEHIYAAFELAYMLLRHGTGPTAQDRVAFTVMFLTLVPRMQDSGLNQLMYFFEGVRCPQNYRYHLSTIRIGGQLFDLLEYVEIMGCIYRHDIIQAP